MKVSLEDIKTVVCDYYGLEKELLFSKNRRRYIMIPRQAFVYLAYHINQDLGYCDLSKYMGFNHATLIHSNKRVQGFMDVDKTYKAEIKDMWSSCLDLLIPKDQRDINRMLVLNLTDKLLHCKTNDELREVLTETLERV